MEQPTNVDQKALKAKYDELLLASLEKNRTYNQLRKKWKTSETDEESNKVMDEMGKVGNILMNEQKQRCDILKKIDIKDCLSNVKDSEVSLGYTGVMMELAKVNGYEFGISNMFDYVEKEGLRFWLSSGLPSKEDYFLGAEHRIYKLKVYREIDEENSELVFDFDRALGMACEDPEVQKEIDKVVAIFG